MDRYESNDATRDRASHLRASSLCTTTKEDRVCDAIDLSPRPLILWAAAARTESLGRVRLFPVAGGSHLIDAVTGMIGSLQALEVMKVVLGEGDVLSGKLLVVNG